MSLSPTLRRAAAQEDLLFPEAGPLHDDAFHERRLPVDAYETAHEIVVKAPIPGARADGIDVFLQHDMLTIRGRREAPQEAGARALTRECEWGSFSRSIILPAEVDPKRIDASLRDGVLTVRLHKTERAKKVDVREEYS